MSNTIASLSAVTQAYASLKRLKIKTAAQSPQQLSANVRPQALTANINVVKQASRLPQATAPIAEPPVVAQPVRTPPITSQLPIKPAPQASGLNALLGDIDGDGKVAFSDVTALLAQYGKSGGNGDLNGDGNINDADKNIVLSRFGTDVGNATRKQYTTQDFGDANGDGQVNFKDITAILSNYGAKGGASDINNDGTVDGADLKIAQAYFGQNVGTIAGLANKQVALAGGPDKTDGPLAGVTITPIKPEPPAVTGSTDKPTNQLLAGKLSLLDEFV
jgi:hypothetical protein